MKKSVLLAVIGGLIAGALVMALLKNRASTPGDGVESEAIPGATPSTAATGQPSAAGTAAAVPTISAAANLPPPSPRELQSLREMAKIVRDAVKPGARMEDLLRTLQEGRQQPFISRNGSAETGALMIVRTKNPPPGTRYFTAQYFTDANGAKSLQHISFEFKPGSTSYEEAVKISREILGAPAEVRGRFTKWNLPDNRIHWINEPTVEQLIENPINPHTREDAGTVVFAIEDEIH